MADVALYAPAVIPAGQGYTVPGSMEILVKSVRASFDGSGAAGAYVPVLQIVSDGGVVVAECPLDSALAAGASADVTWFPGLVEAPPVTPEAPRNLGDLGLSGDGTLGTTHNHTVQFQNVKTGDAILVLAMAPSLPAALSQLGHATICTDSIGNSYLGLGQPLYEANPPNVNEGVHITLFYCTNSIGPLVNGTDTIDVTWNNPVYDRVVAAWLVRPGDPSENLFVLARTADHDAATYAATQMTLTSPNYFPDRDNSLEFALLVSAKVGGVGGFGGVGGYNGFLQVEGRGFVGSQQSYLVNQQTSGANALVINEPGVASFEIDEGLLPNGVLVPAFNGVGQLYTSGANAWKGIILFAVT